jgi:mannitol/fructose-specific phosphotransferase system IIA component (Ntr-type)
MVPCVWLTPGVRKSNVTETAPLVLDLNATTEEGVIKEMIRSLAGRAEIRDLQALQRAVLERQKLQVPLLENGVALPHARI